MDPDPDSDPDADPNPDADPDPAIFIIDLQDPNKKLLSFPFKLYKKQKTWVTVRYRYRKIYCPLFALPAVL
jgi:hypothetical protein